MTDASFPPISISLADRGRLGPLARQAVAEGHPVGGFLLSELKRAKLCAAAELPPDTVRVNDWVAYRVDEGLPAESRILVHPEDYRNPAIHISVLSPLGAALLGLRAGARMPYRSIEGMVHVATVESLDPPIALLPFLQVQPPPVDPAGSESNRA